MSWTTSEARRVLASLSPGQLQAIRAARRRAGELLLERGWVQGQEWSEDGRLCISGALYAAAWEAENAAWNLDRACWVISLGCSGSGVAETAKRVICMELGLTWTPRACPLRTWNDRAVRRLEEVLAVLRGPVALRDEPIRGVSLVMLAALVAPGSRW